jgi:hypothetical protein
MTKEMVLTMDGNGVDKELIRKEIIETTKL